MTDLRKRTEYLSKLKYGIDYSVENNMLHVKSAQLEQMLNWYLEENILFKYRNGLDTALYRNSLKTEINRFFDMIGWPIYCTIENDLYKPEDVPMSGHIKVVFYKKEPK